MALCRDGADERQGIGGGHALLVHPLQILAELEAHAGGRPDRGMVDVGVDVGDPHPPAARGFREGEAEALTGVRAGRVLSRENKIGSECRRCPYIRRQYLADR